MTPEDRIRRRSIDDGECLMWTGCRDDKGYGRINVDGRIVFAHRVMCEVAYGPAPADKGLALHTCDVPSCVNPAHLYWGDAADNRADCVSRGRASGGRAGATDCVNGHPFTDDNTYWEPRGWGRACKACRRQRVREYRARKSAA